MKARIVTLILGMAVAAAQPAAAQDTLQTLNFRDAVKIGLKRNVALLTQQNNLMQSRALKTNAYGLMGPQVYAQGSASQYDGNRFIQQTGTLTDAVSTNVNASINANMPLFQGLSAYNTARSASVLLDAQMEGVKRSTQDVIGSIASQYLQVLLDQELVVIAKENVATLTQQLSQTKAQVELGARSPVDEYNQQALLNAAQIAQVQAEYTLVNDKITLFQTLVLETDGKTVLEEPSWDINAIAMDSIDLKQMQEIAKANRSDLKQIKLTERSSRYLMSAAKGNYFPSVYAFYTLGSSYNKVKGEDQTTRSFSNQFRTDNLYTNFGISFNIPIFMNFTNRYTYVRNKVTYENAKLTTRAREITINGDVLRAYENFYNFKKNYATSITGLEASKVAFSLEQERYNLGITSFVDMANANKTLVTAQTNTAQAKYRFLFQKILLDYATGTLKIDDLP